MPLNDIAFALPSVKQTSKDIAAATGADEAFVSGKVGLATRYILGPEETGVGLAAKACEALFENSPDLRDTVDVLICVGQTPDQPIPHNASQVVEALGLPDTVASFDISLGCSGYVYGLKIAEGFLAATGKKNAVLVTCDPYSRIMAAENKDTNCVFGDAAAATWVSAQDGQGIVVALDFGTDGSGAHAIEVPAGGARKPSVSLGQDDTHHYDRDELRLHMQGRAVFNFVNKRIPQSISNCLDAAGLTLDDIDLFALHQGSVYMLDALAKRVGIPQDKLLKNMNRYGNTVSSSIPLLLSELQARGELRGKRVLMSGFGVGLSWATAVVEFKE